VLPLSQAAATIIAQQPKRASDLIFGNGNERGFSGSGTLSDGRRSAKCRT
jgi:hypothetical protein